MLFCDPLPSTFLFQVPRYIVSSQSIVKRGSRGKKADTQKGGFALTWTSQRMGLVLNAIKFYSKCHFIHQRSFGIFCSNHLFFDLLSQFQIFYFIFCFTRNFINLTSPFDKPIRRNRLLKGRELTKVFKGKSGLKIYGLYCKICSIFETIFCWCVFSSLTSFSLFDVVLKNELSVTLTSTSIWVLLFCCCCQDVSATDVGQRNSINYKKGSSLWQPIKLSDSIHLKNYKNGETIDRV